MVYFLKLFDVEESNPNMNQETYTSSVPSYEKHHLKNFKPISIEENQKFKYSSPSPALNTMGNPYSEIQIPNYSREAASDFFNSKEKTLTTQQYYQ